MENNFLIVATPNMETAVLMHTDDLQEEIETTKELGGNAIGMIMSIDGLEKVLKRVKELQTIHPTNVVVIEILIEKQETTNRETTQDQELELKKEKTKLELLKIKRETLIEQHRTEMMKMEIKDWQEEQRVKRGLEPPKRSDNIT